MIKGSQESIRPTCSDVFCCESIRAISPDVSIFRPPFQHVGPFASPCFPPAPLLHPFLLSFAALPPVALLDMSSLSALDISHGNVLRVVVVHALATLATFAQRANVH